MRSSSAVLAFVLFLFFANAYATICLHGGTVNPNNCQAFCQLNLGSDVMQGYFTWNVTTSGNGSDIDVYLTSYADYSQGRWNASIVACGFPSIGMAGSPKTVSMDNCPINAVLLNSTTVAIVVCNKGAAQAMINSSGYLTSAKVVPGLAVWVIVVIVIVVILVVASTIGGIVKWIHHRRHLYHALH